MAAGRQTCMRDMRPLLPLFNVRRDLEQLDQGHGECLRVDVVKWVPDVGLHNGAGQAQQEGPEAGRHGERVRRVDEQTG